jgi:hypothetical protein
LNFGAQEPETSIQEKERTAKATDEAGNDWEWLEKQIDMST